MRAAICTILGAVVLACGSPPGTGQGTIQPPPIEAGDAGPGAQDGGGDYGNGSGSDGGPTAQSVDPWKELVLVDSSVVLDARTSNAANGPWSFRQLMERLGAPGLTESWLRTYRQTSLNAYSIDDRAAVEELISSWPRRDGALDLSRAPFRLLAIVSRLDLTSSASGEARLIYGLYDPATGAPRKMTVAFEYKLPALGTANDRAEWARRWHALGTLAYGAELNAGLQTLTDAFAQRAWLSQVRANEQQFGALWQLRQWILQESTLRLSTTPQTPDQGLNGSARLARYILDNADALRAGTATLPQDLLGGVSPEIGAWVFAGEARIDEPLRHAFARQTCNGCHAQETNSVQGFFHVSPFKPLAGNGRDRVSDFLKGDEMARRVSRLQELLR